MRTFSGLATTLCIACASPLAVTAQTTGQDSDIVFAEAMWTHMETRGLVGENTVHTLPYQGTQPHGALLETFYFTTTIEGEEGVLVIKRNYGPADVTPDDVLSDALSHLGSVTVMFRRPGYDPEHQDWFYAKYLHDGTLDTNADGVALAGAPARGMVGQDPGAGCVACHAEAAGGDYLFTTDAFGHD